MHVHLIFSLCFIFCFINVNCEVFGGSNIEREVIDFLTFQDSAFTIQTENSRSAISVGLELCRNHIPAVLEHGILMKCVNEIGGQIARLRNDPSEENARYYNTTHISVHSVQKIPTNITYNPNMPVKSSCRGLEGTRLCRAGSNGDQDIHNDLASLKRHHHNTALAMNIPPWNTSDVICTWRHSHLAEEYTATLLSESEDTATFLHPAHRGMVTSKLLTQSDGHSLSDITSVYYTRRDRHSRSSWRTLHLLFPAEPTSTNANIEILVQKL
jgi:hypothetical protein